MSQDKIPTSKVSRATKFVKASVKVGANYLSHNTKKVFNKDISDDDLNTKNADELFKMLNQLKGTALKMAQLMSMDNGLLPKEFADKFAQAQNSAMALSAPMVVNTFRKYIGKSPNDIFDKFDANAVYAASIGQVHIAYKDGEKLAVKMQYPGVADSIQSDINMIKPLVLRVVGISEKAIEVYVKEFEERLIEECDYEKELNYAQKIGENVAHIPNLIVPKYYPKLSAKKIITMQFMEGISLSDYIEKEKNQTKKNEIGQALLDFMHFQIHELKMFHADPHPGNFMVTKDNNLVVLDFGCVKTIPLDFYNNYFALSISKYAKNETILKQCLTNLDIFRANDTEAEKELFWETAKGAIEVISLPMQSDVFYFGDKNYNEKLQQQGQQIAQNKEFRKPNAMRGSKHAIFLHRAFFGMFSILHRLDATVNIDKNYMEKIDF